MEAVYKYWLDVTSGDVREKVVRKGAKGVNDVFKELQKDYGQAETGKYPFRCVVRGFEPTLLREPCLPRITG